MKRRLFLHNPSSQGFSIALSSELIGIMLSICKNVLLLPTTAHLFRAIREEFPNQVSEFTYKLSSLVLNKRLDKKFVLGAKLTIYYEDED